MKPCSTLAASKRSTDLGSLMADCKFLHVKETDGSTAMPGWKPSVKPQKTDRDGDGVRPSVRKHPQV